MLEFNISVVLDNLFALDNLLQSILIESGFLSDVAVFEGILIGISVPISLQVVSGIADRYKDQEIAQIFIRERTYKLQYILFLTNIVLAIFLKFLKITNMYILLFVFFWFIINIIIFYKFIKLVERYTTSTDEVILSKLKNHVENFFKT